MEFAPADAASPDHISYLDGVAATPGARTYKDSLLAALRLRTGHAVVDVGCGPGTDLRRLADAVGPRGRVLGVDQDPRMTREARRRHAEHGGVSILGGDAHALPLADAGVDRARVDRVTQHLPNPPRALTELRRVLRPGGIVGIAEPDWDTLVIDGGDLAVSRVLTRYMADRVRNGRIGRQLSRLLAGAGFTPTSLDAHAVAYGDYDAAEQVLGIRRSLVRAVHDGYLTEKVARTWMDDLRTAPFTACVTIFTVTAQS